MFYNYRKSVCACVCARAHVAGANFLPLHCCKAAAGGFCPK